MSDILIFITATVHCGATPYVARQDPSERMRDYLRAFRGWTEVDCGADILFCENSNADLTVFHKAAAEVPHKNMVRIITFSGNTGAQERGKGYGEVEMLRYAFDSIPELKQYRYVIKVSGRYQLMNAVDLVRRISQMKADLICDIHANLTYADTRTVAFKPEVALDHLIPYQDELSDQQGVIIEHLMARCVHRTLLAGGSWEPMPCTPFAHGISGTTNTLEPNTLLYRAKQNLKRRVARWIYSG